MRGHDHWLTHELDLTKSEAPHPHPFPTARAISKDTALREQRVVATIWMVYVTEPS